MRGAAQGLEEGSGLARVLALHHLAPQTRIDPGPADLGLPSPDAESPRRLESAANLGRCRQCRPIVLEEEARAEQTHPVPHCQPVESGERVGQRRWPSRQGRSALPNSGLYLLESDKSTLCCHQLERGSAAGHEGACAFFRATTHSDREVLELARHQYFDTTAQRQLFAFRIHGSSDRLRDCSILPAGRALYSRMVLFYRYRQRNDSMC